MTTMSHFLMPVVVAGVYDELYCRKHGQYRFKWYHFVIIGLCGTLPDILYPHFGLYARYFSWPHTAWFAIFSILVGCIVYIFIKPSYRILVIFGVIGILLHLVCDIISGGLMPFYPYSDFKTGDYYIPSNHWFKIDLVLFISAYVLIRVYRLWKGRIKQANTNNQQ
jgi:hypothetical protein